MAVESPLLYLPCSRELAPIADPLPGSPEAEMAALRFGRRISVEAIPWLPNPDAAARGNYAVVDWHERHIAPSRLSDEYENGAGDRDDHVWEVGRGLGGVVLTAEHATHAPRDGGSRDAEPGTGGLAAAVAKQYGRGLIMDSYQTMNPSKEGLTHPLRGRLEELLPASRGFISVHGMSGRTFTHPDDPTTIHASIGLGPDPSTEQLDFGYELMDYARAELGVFAVVGNRQRYYVETDTAGKLKRTADGTPYTHQLAALKPYMTTAQARRVYDAQRRPHVPAVQIELAPLLLATALDGTHKAKTETTHIIGTSLGVQLVAHAARMCIERAG